jgi:HEAT repeat protein
MRRPKMCNMLKLIKKIKRAPVPALMLAVAWIFFLASFCPSSASAQTAGLPEKCRAELESILKSLHDYDFASGVDALEKLHAFIRSHKDDPAARVETEAKLLAFIQGEPAPNPGGLLAACRALRLVGTAKSVPALERLLYKKDSADAARFALEKIPGPEAENALVAALGKTAGALRLGVISSLGERGAKSAAGPLAGLAGGSDQQTAAAAVNALAKIGDEGSITALRRLFKKAAGPFKENVAAALVASAERLERSGADAAAGNVYDELLAGRTGAAVRQAAFRGKLRTAGPAGRDLIMKTLNGRDAGLFAPAIELVPRCFDQDAVKELTPLVGKLPEAGRVQLVSILAGYKVEAARNAVTEAASDQSLPVRLEALRALGRVGDASSVEFLARRAAASAGAEQAAAREALARLKGSDVDKAVAGSLAKAADEAVKAELIRAAGERRVAEAKSELMSLLKDEAAGAGLKLRAAAALRGLSGPADVPGLTSLLLAVKDESLREAMEDTVAAAAASSARDASRSSYIAGLIESEKDAGRKSVLLRVLGKIGEDSSLPLVRRALAESDPAVRDAAARALADWPTASARDDVFSIASRASDLTQKVLALRAFVRMVGLEPFRNPEAAAGDLERALGLAARPEEKKLILAGLTSFPCEKSLKLAEALAADPALKSEAEAALARIKRALK